MSRRSSSPGFPADVVQDALDHLLAYRRQDGIAVAPVALLGA
jgi:hypothetical protein